MNYRKRLALIAISAAALAVPFAANAQEETSGHMLSLIELHVKAGHEDDFRAGIAAWKECYLEKKGTSSWNTWRRQQGQGTVYVAAFFMGGWADLDTPDEAARACRSVALEKITPYTHAEQRTNFYARLMTDISRSGPGGDVVWVSNFRADDGRLMMDVVKKVGAAMKEVEGDFRGFWYSVMGGHEKAPDYFVVTPFENFAGLAQDRDGVWEIVTKVHGEAEADKLRADFMKSMDAGWSYMYRRVPDLSHNPE
jgi:hypothetical protein